MESANYIFQQLAFSLIWTALISFRLFVNETGGKLFYNRSDIVAEIKQSQELGSNYYTLAYRPRVRNREVVD